MDNELMTKWEHEHDMARLEIANKRLWILVIIVFASLVITNGAWLYYESQWEVVEETTEQTVTQNVRSAGDSEARKRDSKGRYARDYSRRPMDERIQEMMMNDPEMQSSEDWQRYANRMNG